MKTSPPMRASLVALALAALGACANRTPAPEPAASQAQVDQHVANAKRIAGDDLAYLMPVCRPQPAERAAQGAAADEALHKLIAQPAPPAAKALDNLYYVGTSWVSAWVLKTSEGLILLDALNNTREAHEVIERGMLQLGLDPRQLKYIVVSHGHGDHYGGAQVLADTYHARVIASDIDWKMMETKLEFESKEWDSPPKRDIAVTDGQSIRLGDTTMSFYVTPGHTLGTLATVFDVKAGGARHKAMIWGGTSFNFGRDLDRLDGYVASSERMREVARKAGVDIPLSNHPAYDGTFAKLQALAANPSGPNPFLTGPDAVDRTLRVLGECARAQKTRFLMP